MKKIIGRHWLYEILGQVIIAIIGSLLFAFISNFFPTKTKIVFIVLMILLGVCIIIFLFAYGGILQDDECYSGYFCEYETEKKVSGYGKSSQKWVELLSDGKKVTFKVMSRKILAELIVALAITVCAIIEVILFHNRFFQEIVITLIFMITLLSIVFWFGTWIALIAFYKRNQCKQCGCLMSYIVDKFSNFRSGSYMQTKKEDVETTIGYIVSDGKVTDTIRGYGGTREYERETEWWSSDAICYCKYCGAEKKVTKRHSLQGEWKLK